MATSNSAKKVARLASRGKGKKVRFQSGTTFPAVVAIVSALMVVLSKNPVHSVLFLVLTFFSIAGHYILLNAQFLAISHIIVYAGAIMVLFLFVIMLLNLNEHSVASKNNLMKGASIVAAGMLMCVMVAALKGADDINVGKNISNENIGLVHRLGQVLYTDYILPFEIASVLFLIAMIGAVILAKKDKGISQEPLANSQ